MRKTVTLGSVIIIFIAIAGSGFVYMQQDKQYKALMQQKASVGTELQKLRTQYASAQAASKISTDSWKKYCSPKSPVCFSYPAAWTLEGGEVGESGYVSAVVTDPEKTTTISFADPLIKDGGTQSAHIVSVSDITIASQKIKLVGSYPVASGDYEPSYIALADAGLAQKLTAGKLGLAIVNGRFDISGQYPNVHLSAFYSGKSVLITKGQADAWFESTDGRTARKIMESLSAR